VTDKNPLVVFSPSGKRGRFPVGTPILHAARSLGVDLDSVCGGRGICSRCQITPSFGSFPKYQITASESSLSKWNEIEARYDRVRGLKKGRRLGCQAKIQADIIVDVPPESQVHKQIVRKSADVRPVVMKPSTRLYFITVDEPDMHNPEGDFERIKKALKEQWEIASVELDFSLITNLQKALRTGEWKLTLALWQDHRTSIPRITQLWPGFFDGPLHGLAMDLGSTTIALHICDLRSGDVVASTGIMNPQIRFGEDLMSRVSYSMMNQDGDRELTHEVRKAIDELISTTAAENQIDLQSIVDMVIVCNPVMHHLLIGVDPVELGQAPFALAISSAMNILASQLELSSLSQSVPIYLLPCIAGHVGADAAGVILSVEPQKATEKTLVVDVGTNAEIIFGNQSIVLACSSPTGPAFEGAQITSGQRATPGAIEKVRINPQTKEPRFKIIGSELWSDEKGFDDVILDAGVHGICGSGIIEVIAEMRMAGIIDNSGLIGSKEEVGSNRLVKNGRTNAYVLYEDKHSDAAPILVTQNDIRAIQLAKSALYAGARLLMKHFGTEEVERIILAGAFGSHISVKHAMVLGMIPDCDLQKVVSAGNAAGSGARIALCNIQSRQGIENVVLKILKVETAIDPNFQEHFVNANAIPHAIDEFPNLTKAVNLPQTHFNRSGSRKRKRQRDT